MSVIHLQRKKEKQVMWISASYSLQLLVCIPNQILYELAMMTELYMSFLMQPHPERTRCDEKKFKIE